MLVFKPTYVSDQSIPGIATTVVSDLAPRVIDEQFDIRYDLGTITTKDGKKWREKM